MPLFAALILACANLRLEKWLPGWCCKLIQVFGKLSFAFYLTQTFANRLVGKWMKTAYWGIAIDGNKKILLFSLLFNILFAVILYWLADCVVGRFINNKLIALRKGD